MNLTTQHNSNFDLSANFNTNRVSTTLSKSSFIVTNNLTPDVGIALTTGAVTGANGTISGNSINLGTLTGTITPTSFTINGVPQTLTAAGSYTVTGLTNVNFVGTNADGIYQNGTGTIDGVAATTEIAAARN